MLHTTLLAAAFLTLFAITELLYHRLHVKVNMTRKIVHVFTGLLTLLFPPLLTNHWYVMALCGSFLLILLVSMPLKLLPSINAVDRKTSGSILYPIVVYGCYLVYQHYNDLTWYYLPILTLALCDPIAELIGRSLPRGRYSTFGHQKTLSGSLGFFTSSLILSIILLVGVSGYPLAPALILAACLAVSTTIAEALSHGGFDNLTIPATVLGILFIYQHYSAT